MTLSQNQIKKLHRDALTALETGRAREAHQLCMSILQEDRRHADAWFLCGVIAGQNGKYSKAIEILANAISLAPNRAQYHAELAKQYLGLGELRNALEIARKACSFEPEDMPSLNILGTVMSHCGDHEGAINNFEKAVSKMDANAESTATYSIAFCTNLFFNFAVSLQFAGRFADAELAYERIIELDSAFFKAHSALSTLRRQTPERNHLSRLKALKPKINSIRDQLHLGHALAKEYEDLGDYAQAWDSLIWAKEERKKEVQYNPSTDANLFSQITSAFSGTSGTDNNSMGCDSEEPIFIVGMPRTGTTLLEQVLGSHTKVFAAGELQNFPLQVRQLSGSTSIDFINEEIFARAQNISRSELGATYIDSTRPRTGHTERFIDKLPLNFLFLGLINEALPRARLICLRRDPMDTCLSNFRQLFATDFRHYHYNYDLLDCGRYYIEFDALMQHWRKSLGHKMLEIQYETLVEHPEQEVRKLLEFCDLPWEDACLNFHKREASIATPSAVQVRQGIYSDSIARWKKYGDHMSPLYNMLKDAGLYS
jgi:tetratricopeptide (TPR) repeat protein